MSATIDNLVCADCGKVTEVWTWNGDDPYDHFLCDHCPSSRAAVLVSIEADALSRLLRCAEALQALVADYDAGGVALALGDLDEARAALRDN